MLKKWRKLWSALFGKNEIRPFIAKVSTLINSSDTDDWVLSDYDYLFEHDDLKVYFIDGKPLVQFHELTIDINFGEDNLLVQCCEEKIKQIAEERKKEITEKMEGFVNGG